MHREKHIIAVSFEDGFWWFEARGYSSPTQLVREYIRSVEPDPDPYEVHLEVFGPSNPHGDSWVTVVTGPEH